MLNVESAVFLVFLFSALPYLAVKLINLLCV